MLVGTFVPFPFTGYWFENIAESSTTVKQFHEIFFGRWGWGCLLAMWKT
jgi:hypothetical protein